MHSIRFVRAASMAAFLAFSAVAAAEMPVMGGPMRHVLVSMVDDTIHVEVPPSAPPVLQWGADQYDEPASVLNGKAVNAQYGWLADGFIALPPGALIWIRAVDQPPALESYRAFTFEPIFGTDGSAPLFGWNGQMTHNWYAASVPGAYSATYELFVGDADGNAIDGYVGDTVTLDWVLPASSDLDGNGTVDGADLGLLLAAWGTDDPVADLDGNGIVDGADLGVLLGDWS
ncbi:MAG: hypothetical protein KDA22_11310 [Phycisphaerales bacterium]|nr:hypothetical protein [Phycisphaerales bacterium]